ncbi:MAG: GAF domain-containing protein [Bacteroidales bacterium]|nr:GAF domain-containing protein [Bacteroidales bacterium]
MKPVEKYKKQITLITIAYSVVALGILGFAYIKPNTISTAMVAAILAACTIITTITIYSIMKELFSRATSNSDDFSMMSEEERKEEEEKKRIQMEKIQSQARAEQEKKMIAEKVAEIASPLDEEVFPENYFDQLLINLSKTLNIVQGVAYTINRMEGKYEIKSTYAYYTTDTSRKFEIGEGITGQVAKDQKILMLDTIPENYIHIVSGLGNSSPKILIVIPVVYDDETISLLELASFEKPTMNMKEFFSQFNNKISAKVSDLLK